MDRTSSVTGSGSTSPSLVQRLGARDAEAWRRFCDLYGPLVYHWCQQSQMQPADAADVVQEVCSAVSKSIERFDGNRGGGSFRGWLRTITRNKINDFYRRAARQARAAGGTDAQMQMALVGESIPDEASAIDDRREQVLLCHRALEIVRAEFEQRTWGAFWRVVVEGQSTADVAAEMRVTPNAVRQAKSRVLRRLREELDT
jgi:RNA polymerase sigma-70 factor (ECF subfamily)